MFFINNYIKLIRLFWKSNFITLTGLETYTNVGWNKKEDTLKQWGFSSELQPVGECSLRLFCLSNICLDLKLFTHFLISYTENQTSGTNKWSEDVMNWIQRMNVLMVMNSQPQHHNDQNHIHSHDSSPNPQPSTEAKSTSALWRRHKTHSHYNYGQNVFQHMKILHPHI